MGATGKRPTSRNLVLIRHAEAVSVTAGIADLRRPLSPRGYAQATLMGTLLGYSKLYPDLILCSHSERTVSTARILAQAMNLEQDNPVEDSRIYLNDIATLLRVIHGVPDHCRRVFMVGHNPDISELIAELSGKPMRDQPPGTVASLCFDLDSWGYVAAGKGTLNFCIHPDQYDLGL
ncbi:MAG: SixA phosphatase family protein [Methylococcaceae bacterium]